MTTICIAIRASSAGSDREQTIRTAVAGLRTGQQKQASVYPFALASLGTVPGAPLSYWLGASVRNLFRQLPPFAVERRTAKQGLATANDFRFMRAWWEVSPNAVLRGTDSMSRSDLARAAERVPWTPITKGGEFSPFYSDLSWVVKWLHGGKEMRVRVNPASNLPYANIWQLGGTERDYFFRDGLTHPRRLRRLAVAPLPRGSIISIRGSGIFTPEEDLYALSGLMSSAAFDHLVRSLLGRLEHPQFDDGAIRRVPVPVGWSTSARLSAAARSAITISMGPSTASECTHIFLLPAVMQVSGANLAERAAAWQWRVNGVTRELAAIQDEIDRVVFDLYGLEEEDRQAILRSLGESSAGEESEVEESEEDEAPVAAGDPVVQMLSYAVGVALGRFDVRYATGEFEPPELPDPFAPLPVCSPGMLADEDGLPLSTEPPGYPLRVSWDGVLVDDPGLAGSGSHADDIVSRVREVLTLLWGERAEEIEHEASELIGAKSLRDYFRRPSGFFAEHLRSYSKSRRPAPIYWPLATATGSYTLWLYYPRLDEDLLYTAANRYLEPKMAAVGRRLDELDAQLPSTSGREATELRREREEIGALLTELADLRSALLRVADLPYRPDLDDGVLICAAPLAKLFRLRQWRRELEDCWAKLERGDYDWAHLARAIWPERVLEACRRDRSVAVAHGAEEASVE